MILMLCAPVIVVILVLFLAKKSPSSGGLPPAIPARSLQDRLHALEELKNGKLISETEYDTKREELLKQL